MQINRGIPQIISNTIGQVYLRKIAIKSEVGDLKSVLKVYKMNVLLVRDGV